MSHSEPKSSASDAGTVHGGIDFQELARRGLAPDRVMDFSTNVNPFGPSPRVLEVLGRVRVDRYPDRDSIRLREILAQRHATEPDRLLVGNGSSELINLIGLDLIEPGDSVLVPRPTYGEYARVARLRQAHVVEVSAPEESWPHLSEGAFQEHLERDRPRVCFLCRPNNPTGELIPITTVEHWAEQFPGTWFVVDEAYLDYLPLVPSAISLPHDNILVLRSLGKAHALAGLRVGYLHGTKEILGRLRRWQAPWSVSEIAQEAASVALQDVTHLDRSLIQLREARRSLLSDLRSAGFSLLEGVVPYFLMAVGNGAAVRSALLDRAILVRDCHSFGLPRHIRIFPRLPHENERLVSALRDCLDVPRGGNSFP
jgi:histidinol-phosphate aminotransferase